MRKKLSNWSKLVYLGIDNDSEEDYKEIVFLNRFVISQLLIIMAYVPFEFFLFEKKLIPGHLLYGLLSLLCLIFHKYKKFSLSKFYFIILMNLNIFYWVIEVGGKTETEFFYLAAALFGFLLFREKKWLVGGQMILSIGLFFLVRKLATIIPPSVPLTDDMAEDISTMSNLIIFILIFIIIRHLTEVWNENAEILNYKKDLIERKNLELNDSITYAKRIQRAIIPKMEIVEDFLSEGFELDIPRDKLSGDFSFYHKQSEDIIWLAAADCTGHGVPGSLVSVLGVNILYKAIVEKKLNQPNEVLDFATIEMEESLNRFSDSIVKDGMDISLVRIEKTTSGINLTYAGAHNPIWLITNDDNLTGLSGSNYKKVEFEDKFLLEIPPDRQPIGSYFKRTLFTHHQLTVKSGCRIFLFSDGYADQFGGERNKKLTKARFKTLLLENSINSMRIHTRVLKNYVRSWANGLEQVDDILVIGIEL